MKRVEALALNNVLSEIKITGEGISRDTRSAVMKIKISLSAIATDFDTRRTAIQKEVEHLSDENKEVQFRELLSSQLDEEVELSITPISDDALNTVLDRNHDLKTSSVEMLYTHIVEKQWNS